MREEVDVGEDVLLVGLVALEAELEDVGGDLLVLGKKRAMVLKSCDDMGFFGLFGLHTA